MSFNNIQFIKLMHAISMFQLFDIFASEFKNTYRIQTWLSQVHVPKSIFSIFYINIIFDGILVLKIGNYSKTVYWLSSQNCPIWKNMKLIKTLSNFVATCWDFAKNLDDTFLFNQNSFFEQNFKSSTPNSLMLKKDL